MMNVIDATSQQIVRIAREPNVHTAAVLVAAPVTAAGLHAVGITTDLPTSTLAMGLVNPDLWFTLAITGLFGGTGGFIAELLSLQGNIELPHRVKRGRAKRTRLAE